MLQIQATAAFTIPEDNRAAFRGVADELIAAVREGEPDTLQYLWYFSEDGGKCSVREIYRNADGVRRHLENCAEILPRLMSLGTLRLELCGPVPDDLRAALAPSGADILSCYSGVDRILEV